MFLRNIFKKRVRVRSAPSPTGDPHIGNLRTVLFNYLFAKSEGGVFIIRVEDTDRKRNVPESDKKFLSALRWLGLLWDKGPYYQSQRLSIYKSYAETLIKKKHAYYCFCDEERLNALRVEQENKGAVTKYDKFCLSLSPEKVEANLKSKIPYVIRMSIPSDSIITFNDMLRGAISVSGEEVDDQIIIKSDGFPTYHLASVIDDYKMRITHVIRGEEWLPSTPKHILLYKFFGWKPPLFVHVPLVLNSKRQKLSKREGSFAVETLAHEGYLPSAVVNYLALLGWHPEGDREIYLPEELISLFHLESLQKAPAIFDYEKLKWFNAQHIRKLSISELKKAVLDYFRNYGYGLNAPDDFFTRFLEVEQNRLTLLKDAEELIKPFLADKLAFERKMLLWKNMTEGDVKNSLSFSLRVLENVDESEWNTATLEKILKENIEKEGLTNGEVLWPLRVALTGKEKSPSPFECAYILGKEKTLLRIDDALKN